GRHRLAIKHVAISWPKAEARRWCAVVLSVSWLAGWNALAAFVTMRDLLSQTPLYAEMRDRSSPWNRGRLPVQQRVELRGLGGPHVRVRRVDVATADGRRDLRGDILAWTGHGRESPKDEKEFTAQELMLRLDMAHNKAVWVGNFREKIYGIS
ncbi:unnamed protein product, partial [Prorocentrum cordatum]